MSIFITSALLALASCTICVVPRLTPRNSFGMMLDGFPVKDLFNTRLFIYFTVLCLVAVFSGQPDLAAFIWVYTSVIFIIFTVISGWHPFYARLAVLCNTILGAAGLYFLGHHLLLVAIPTIILFIVTSYLLFSFGYQEHNEQKRYERWISRQVKVYLGRFGDLLPANRHQRKLVLSLIFIEDMSRPAIVRYFENVLHFIKGGVMSTGIMQVQAEKNLTDKKSVILGIKMVKQLLSKNGIKPHEGPEGFRSFAVAWNSHEDYRFLLQIVYAIINLELK